MSSLTPIETAKAAKPPELNCPVTAPYISSLTRHSHTADATAEPYIPWDSLWSVGLQ